MSSATGTDLSHVLRSPRITEKATMHQETGVYTFDVAERATKSEVRDAVRSLYGVVPRKVRIVPIPSKQKRNARTGMRGFARGGKKAYVYLKRGESITIT
ncbi:50S ribosomal protein L23 [Candidatus Kaiserbacteria bacterium RIFCSPLOWO2_01_FULL_54_13]|uniref:Large ribosomal subunit protein uL23 n=1 Tax=Candidatus Kaiserbacteria bacterium RIFCSPLOWO2_01_FULL_54_13 TaxID=1798512 RepID=A0A1F6F360_9BACT|nr:MAG: 50S ribosomal protein L23 [Candidatus Kaiserbacteria bacterium RIFCSPLOWO2_01_FULL_54_13]